jgi:UDP-GlcNAc:undecaprenyl-phosphate GlcNAc-1-phosphate transferase
MFVSFVVAMVVTMALIPLFVRIGARIGMLDEPGPRKVHNHPVPRVGGVAMLIGMCVPLLALQSLPPLGILAGVLIVVAAGVWDDYSSLDYRIKLVAQFVAALLVVAVGGVEIRQMVLIEELVLPRWISFPLTVLVLVALTNAINLSDGLDGLAGGISFLCAAALGVLAYATGNTPALLLAVALCGALFGFLRFNTHPATVFMGDGGSQLLGLAIGSLAILVTQSESSLLSATAPLFLLAIPILDTAFVVIQRLREGHSPFLADKNHLHHRLLKMGFGHMEAVSAIYLVQAGLFAAAYLLRYESDLLNIGAFLSIGCLMLFSLEKDRALILQRAFHGVAGRTARRRWFNGHRLAVFATNLLYAALIAYCALAAVVLDTPTDISVLLGILFLVVLAAATMHASRVMVIVTRGAAYILAATLAYLFADASAVSPLIHHIEMSLVIGIAVATVAALRFAEKTTFLLNSMDLLVLFMTIIVPNLPGTAWGDTNLPSLAARLAVLFYALEFMLRDGREQKKSNPVVALLALGSLAIKGIA